MIRRMLCLALLASAATVCAAEKQQRTKGASNVPPVLNYKMKSLDGKEVDLSKYRGKVLLVVNTASQCGYTPQYAGLEQLYEQHAKQGLVVLGFPCNQFGAQEPGTAEEIGAFCRKNYGVTFPLFQKIDVNGPQQAPLYKYLTSKETDAPHAGPIRWNFEKFLIGRHGQVVARFGSGVEPDAAELVRAVEAELARKAE